MNAPVTMEALRGLDNSQSVLDDTTASNPSPAADTSPDLAELASATVKDVASLRSLEKESSKILDVTDEKLGDAVAQLKEFEAKIDKLVDAKQNPDNDLSLLAKQTLNVKLGTNKAARELVDRLDRISEKITNADLKDNFEIHAKATKEKADEIKAGLQEGRLLHGLKTIKLSKSHLMENAIKDMDLVESLLQERKEKGLDQNLSVHLPDGLGTDKECAKYIYNKLKELQNEYPDQLKTIAGRGKIDNPESVFHKFFIKKSRDIVIDKNTLPEQANELIEKAAKELHESQTDDTKQPRWRFTDKTKRGDSFFKDTKNRLQSLFAKHVENVKNRIHKGYKKSNLILATTSSSIFDEDDVMDTLAG